MDIKWRVVYCVTPKGDIPVKEFLDAAKPVVKAKALRVLMHCEEYGLRGIIQHIKKLSGTPLREIRILGADNVRVIFVTKAEKQTLLLHAFYKKSQKTSARELTIALGRLRSHEDKNGR